MTFQEKVKSVGDAHKGLPVRVYHYFRSKIQAPYIIWQENGAVAFRTDNRMSEQGVSGTTDYFTRLENDPVVDQIQEMFNINKFNWTLESVQYEETTGLIHYEWRWEV